MQDGQNNHLIRLDNIYRQMWKSLYGPDANWSKRHFFCES